MYNLIRVQNSFDSQWDETQNDNLALCCASFSVLRGPPSLIPIFRNVCGATSVYYYFDNPVDFGRTPATPDDTRYPLRRPDGKFDILGKARLRRRRLKYRDIHA